MDKEILELLNRIKELNCDEMEFDFIKNTVGSKVVENNE